MTTGARGAGKARALLLAALAALVAGCAEPTPVPTTVPPPEDGGGFGTCHTSAAQTLAVPFRADALPDAGGLAPGLHRRNASTFVWVYASYHDTLRQDRITRLNEVEAYREPDDAAPLEVCTRVELATPTHVDGTRRSYDVAALFTATAGLPAGRVRMLVDWSAGCEPCAANVHGNATALFEP